MGLTREAYHTIEDIVGSEYITEEPAVLDGYCFIWGNEIYFDDRFSARPLAVVMPGSTGEIQKIVKACNKYKIRFKPHASGWEFVGLSARESFLSMDLRRMDRILEIDERNKYAVVEPYVSIRNLMNETIKKGLRPHVPGCGPSGSVIATTCAHFGCGPTTISTDYGGRTPLAVEWVIPDGEVLCLGSLESGAGWFYGDGPGPSLRGVMRGYGGANGGLGVITKAAVKLAPWYGPPEIKGRGKPNQYDYEVPENFTTYWIVFPNQELLANFLYLLAEEAIAYGCQRHAGPPVLALLTESSDVMQAMAKGVSPEEEAKLKYCATVILDWSSPRERQYKEECFQKILEKTEAMVFPLDAKGNGLVFLYTAMGYSAGRIFRHAGSFNMSAVGDESWDSLTSMGKWAAEELLAKYDNSGRILSDGEMAAWGCTYGETCGHLELGFLYDPADPDSVEAAREIVAEADAKVPQHGFGINALEGALSFEEAAHKAALPYCLDFLTWIRRVKKAFDPNLVSESSAYVTPEE